MKKSIILNIALSVINVFLVLIIILSKNDNKLLINDPKQNQLLGIMLEKEVASGIYEKSSASTWPTEGYVFNPILSNCENGSQISWQNGKIVVNTTTTDKCYVYFDKPKTFTLLTAQEIEDKDAQLTNMIKNGSYEDGANNWNLRNNVSLSELYASHGKKSLQFDANIESRYGGAYSNTNYDVSIQYAHSYYGRLMFKSSSSFISSDARLDYCGLNFVQKRSVKAPDWLLLSNILLSNVAITDCTEKIRNFVVMGNEYVYTDELMLIDITESYGDNLPTKEWLDKNLLYFDNSVNIKTVEGIEGEFDVTDASGTFRCSEGGEATIKDGKVIINGTKENTTCVLE